jgi:cobalt-zinc-cadmium efflux system outer membrane protein
MLIRAFTFAITAVLLAGAGLAQVPPQTSVSVDSLTVDQAIGEALEKNLDLMAERYNLPIAEAAIVTASLRPNPVVSIGGDHLDVLGTGFNEVNAAGPPEYSVRTDFLFERGGKRQQRIAVAQAARSMAQLQLLNAMREVVLHVQNAVVDVLQAKADLSLAHENLKAFEEIVRVNSSRVKSGDLAEVELIRSQVAQLQFENTVRQAELRVQTTRAALQLLIGRRRGDRSVDAVGELRREDAPLSMEALRERALAQRPDILAIRQDQARSQADVRLQLAQGKIDYTVGTEYRRQQGLAGKGNSLGIFFQTNIPIFNRNQGEIARARQEQMQVEAKIRALEATIDNEVYTAFLQYQNARTTLGRIEESLLTKARDVRQVTEYSYRRGEASLLEFLDAQRAYNETVQARNEARAEFARSLYAIDAAVGASTAAGVRP